MSVDAIVYSAEPFDGLSAGGTPAAFDAAVFPHDTAQDARGMAVGQSCCGTTCEAILRAAGVDGTMRRGHVTRDWLRAPYAARMGSAIIYQRELGQIHGCWSDCGRHAPGDPLPGPGDMPELEGPAHVETVVGREGMALTVVAGGQPDAITGECSAITMKVRHMTERGGRLYIGGRACTGWLRAGELPCVR